jgi:hypothetical protein
MNTDVKVDLKKLTPAQLEELRKDLLKEIEETASRKRRDRETYEQLKSEAVTGAFDVLKRVSEELSKVKEIVFKDFEDVLKLKKEVFGISDEQMTRQESHTFTTTDGKISIILGSNTIDKWDETVDVGVNMVKEYLATLAKDPESAKLVGFITDLLKPNKDGLLKAGRVLDLAKKAAEIGDARLIEAVGLIRDAYRPQKTSTYIKVSYRDAENNETFLPLSISSI